MAKPKTKAVQINSGMHAGLIAVAAEQTMVQGRRVTLRDLIEEAVAQRWPQLTTSQVVDVSASNGAAAAIFDGIMSAAFGGTAADLPGQLAGHFGQPVKLADLALHLAATMPPVSTLDELVRDYERQQAANEKMLT